MCRKSLSLASLVFALTSFLTMANALEQAYDPTLPDGATDVNPKAVLGWSPGDGAILHHIFLSADFNDVNTGSLLAWKACRTTTAYNTEPLLLGKTYHWRVDEVGYSQCAPGQVWSFTVQDRLTVDDMESYSRDADYIFDTWLDGAGDVNGVGGNGTGSIVELSTRIVRGGSQSMWYAYINSGQKRRRPYSEAKRTFDTPESRFAGGRALGLWFYGNPDNDTEPMYLALDDGDMCETSVYGVLGEDPNDVKKQEWQQWNIDLQDFIDAGLDLSNIISIAIGFGDRTEADAEPGGTGIVYFDDIRLYPRRCVPMYAPVADFSGNCIVDIADIQIMAGEWLESADVIADLYPDNKVDFKDYALLVDSWSEKKLWPAQ